MAPLDKVYGSYQAENLVAAAGLVVVATGLAQHPLEADLPGHNHACVLCALHLDGKLALTPTLVIPSSQVVIGKLVDAALPKPHVTPVRPVPHSRAATASSLIRLNPFSINFSKD